MELPIKLCLYLLSFSFLNQPVNNADFIIPVEIDGTVHQVMQLSCVFFIIRVTVSDVQIKLLVLSESEDL